MLRHGVKWSLLLGALLGLVGPAAAQPVFEERAKDLGGAPRGQVLEQKFKLTNKYRDKELHVAGIRTSCGVCSSATIDKNTIAPGESAWLTMRVDTNKYAGHRTFTAFVTFDRPQYEETFVNVTAVSRDDLSIAPTTLNFGAVRHGSGPTASTTIEYRGGQANWTITGLANDNGYIQPKLEEVSRHFGTTTYKLTVRLRDDLPLGSWHADLWLNTSDATSPRIRVPLTVEVQGALTAAPQSLDLGKVAKGGQLEKKVVLRGAEPFKITKIEGLEGSNIEVTGQSEEAKDVQVLRIRYQAGKDSGEFTKKLRFVTDLKKDNAVDVTLRGSQAP
jgi:hypothetical protein